FRPGVNLSVEPVTPFFGKYRPFIGRCCQTCTPESWGLLYHNHIPSLGFHSVTCVTEKSTRYRGWLVRRLCYFIFIRGRKVYPDAPHEIIEKILKSKRRIQEAMLPRTFQESGQGEVPDLASPKLMESSRRTALRILGKIRAVISPFVLRLTCWVLLRLFNRLFLNVQVHQGQVDMVRNATQQYKAPLVFLSTHKSCLDHLLLSFVLFCLGLRVPYFGCWDSTGLTALRVLLRRLGGICVADCPGEFKSSQVNTMYRAVLNSYVEELLQDGQHLHICLEDLFPNSGHLSPDAVEWLALVFNSFLSGSLSDVALVPVGISYDYILDDSHREETLKSTSGCSGWWAVLHSALRILQRRSGCVRVDFGQPFSLKEYVKTESFSLRTAGSLLEELLLPAVLGQRFDCLDCEKSQTQILKSTVFPELQERERFLVANLGRHTLCSATSSSAIMSTSVFSCLLLHKHREGVFFSQLMRDFSWLIEEILFRNFDVGFSGTLRDVVLHALYLLQNCVTLRFIPPGDLFIAPRKTRQAALELAFYSRAILPVFVSEAVGDCYYNAVSNGTQPNHTQVLKSTLFSQEQLHLKVLQLCHLLPSEVLLLPACQQTFCFCHDAVDKLVQCGILNMEEKDEMERDRPACDAWRKKMSEHLLWKATGDYSDSDSDYDAEAGKRFFKLSQSSRSPWMFCFLCSLLRPLLKAFAEAAVFLGQFKAPVEGKEVPAEPVKYSGVRGEKAIAVKTEYASFDLASSAVRTFRELGVFRETMEAGKATLHLSEALAEPGNRHKLQQFLTQFLYC
uniref:Glycerol-3-phosphate acyltransferase 2, mitochondrial n=1 Tax=Latimeria chalumnae TaxID=7897 RepID=H3ABH3_LATCH